MKFAAGLLIIFLLAGIGIAAAATHGNSDGRDYNVSLVRYPDNNVLNVDISNTTAYPVHTQSAGWITNLSEQGIKNVGHSRIGYSQGFNTETLYIVNASNVSCQYVLPGRSEYYWDSSACVPIPDDMMMVNPQWTDRPAIILDVNNKIAYSLYQMYRVSPGVWSGAVSVWNWSSNNNRFSAFVNGTDNNHGYLGNKYVTSRNGTTPRAERLDIWGGYSMTNVPNWYMTPKYSEIEAGEIKHALYIVVPRAGNYSVWPASSGVGGTGINFAYPPPGGQRFRMNASYDISSAPGEAKIILQALKTYGGIISENGCAFGMQIQIVNDSRSNITHLTLPNRWSATNLTWIRDHIPISAFEFIDESSLMVSRYTFEANVPTAATPPYEGGELTSFRATNASDARMSNATTAAQYLWLHTPGTEIDNSTAIITGVGYNSVDATNKYESLVRYGWCANTSGIPDNATNITAKFWVKGAVGSTHELGNLSALLVGFNPLNKTELVASDFDRFGTVYNTTALRLNSTWSTSDWNTYTLNAAGLYNLSKTGDTCLGLMVKDDYYNTSTEISYSHYNDSVLKIYQNGTQGSSPLLDVYYDIAGVTTAVSFTKSKTVVRIPALIQFTDTSIGSISWNWSFGDGQYSEEQSPWHQYTRSGIFTVNLTINGDESTTDRVIVTRGGGDYQMFTLGAPIAEENLMVNVEDGTYTASRELTEREIERVIENMYKEELGR